jgi:hypothetical protein
MIGEAEAALEPGIPVGFQNSAVCAGVRFSAAHWYSLISPPSTGRRPVSLPVETRGGVIGAWWAKLQCAMWSAAVVVVGVPGKGGP